jgi:hypothetical protein
MRRLALLFAALLACGLIAAGCGDDDEDNGDDSAATTESAPTDTFSIEPTDTTEAEDDSGGAKSPDNADPLDEAVQVCKDNVKSGAAGLSEGLRNDLEELCEKGGNEDDLREASQEICKKIVEERVPEGSRDEALAVCDSAEP